MSQRFYINLILTPHILLDIKRGDDFMFKEDGDSSHGLVDNNNIIRQ